MRIKAKDVRPGHILEFCQEAKHESDDYYYYYQVDTVETKMAGPLFNPQPLIFMTVTDFETATILTLEYHPDVELTVKQNV
jgi:hypothetical protein